MYKEPAIRVRVKQFVLPLEEERLNRTLNDSNVVVIDERVFQDRTGNIVVYLKYEERIYDTAGTTDSTDDDFESSTNSTADRDAINAFFERNGE